MDISVAKNDVAHLKSGIVEDNAPHTSLIELSQVSFLKAYTAHFTLFDGHFVSVYTKNLFTKPKKYWIDLTYLEASPQRIFKIDRPALYATGALGLTSMIFLLITSLSAQPLYWLPVLISLICSTLIAFCVLIYRSKDRYVYYSRYGRINWMEFLINKPNRRSFKEFIEVLTNAIQAASANQSSKHEERLGAELREHRRLKDKGILSSQVYEAIKKQFLGQHIQPQASSAPKNDPIVNKRIQSAPLR